ncbi:MAG TPA: hypothetical protein VFV67_22810 [Actinophytocola sp.]|uniref:hypothetical protein n=1 Tax=Actinophytocola sp. TaxID=1872138 RepID=UPI002DBC59D2|nr:hypothetical protein [Actinophytocola sp.]HEU5473486.1 hypothetical protein [Actinophytocola sp.]
MGRHPHRPAADHPEQARGDLLALLAIADRGIALQDEAVAALRACAVPGEPDGAAARAGGRVANEYHRLWAASLDFAPHADPESLERRLSQLLLHHCQVLHHAIRFAFPKYRSARLERQRRSVVDLGPPAEALCAVRDELAMWLTMR